MNNKEGGEGGRKGGSDQSLEVEEARK